MTRHDEVQLTPFCEVVGTYGGLYADDDCLHVKIGDKTLVFPKGSKEAKTLREKLVDSILGHVVGVLKTDIPVEPIRLRILAEAQR